MSLLYPLFLWLLIPLAVLFFTQKRTYMMTTVHLFVLALLVLTLSRPAIDEGVQENEIEAKDIIIAMDASFSMQATDIKPNRYDFSKQTIESFLTQNTKDNMMLIAFTTNPLLLSPPTTDHQLIKTAMESLNPKFILTKGTSLKRLFSKLSKMHVQNKNLILITDGGEEEDVEALSDLVQKMQVHLTILPMGTKHGATITLENGRMLKDKEKHLVVSRINPLLGKLAARVGANYVAVDNTPEATAQSLQDALDSEELESKNIKKKQHHYTELYQIPLLLALLLFLILHTRASKYLLILFAFFGVSLHASVWDGYYLDKAYHAYERQEFNRTRTLLQNIDTPSLQSQFALGNTYYKMQAYKKALALYSTIHSTNPHVKQVLYYNMANTYTMLKAYDKAKIYYTKALQLGADADALHNRTLIMHLDTEKKAQLGIAHPKSQNDTASKRATQEEKKKEQEERKEDQPSSGSGSGGGSKKVKSDDKEKKQLKMDENEEKVHPLSSKVYELINKGYIRETQPW